MQVALVRARAHTHTHRKARQVAGLQGGPQRRHVHLPPPLRPPPPSTPPPPPPRHRRRRRRGRQRRVLTGILTRKLTRILTLILTRMLTRIDRFCTPARICGPHIGVVVAAPAIQTYDSDTDSEMSETTRTSERQIRVGRPSGEQEPRTAGVAGFVSRMRSPRARARACVRVCARACVRVCVRACVCVCAPERWPGRGPGW